MNKALIIAFLLSALFVLSYFAPFANADSDFNYELTRAVPIAPITHDHILLIYSAPFMHFTQGQIMYFITKIVDTRTLTDNPFSSSVNRSFNSTGPKVKFCVIKLPL